MNIKTMTMLGLMAITPVAAKSQNVLPKTILRNGEYAVSTRPSILKDGSDCMIYFLNNNPAVKAAKAALLRYDAKAVGTQNVHLANGNSITSECSHRVDTIIVSSTEVKGTDIRNVKYYIAGPVSKRDVIKNEKGELVAYIDNNSETESVRKEVSGGVVDEIVSNVDVPIKKEVFEYGLVEKTVQVE